MKKQFTKTWAFLILCLFMTSSMAWGGGATITTTGSGNWSSTTPDAPWPAGTLPGSGDDVIIADGNTVTIDQAVTVASITVGQGTSGILTFDGIAIRAVVVTGSISIATNGQFIVQSTGAFTNTMSIGGNLTNNGTFDMSRGYTSTPTTLCNVTFNGLSGVEQDISGTGTLTRFRVITLSRALKTDLVKSTIDVYVTAPTNTGLTLTTGTWEQYSGNLINGGGNQTLGSANGVLLIDGSGGYTNYYYNGVSWVYTSGSMAVTLGTFTVNTSGTVQIGVGNNSITTGGTINFSAGTVRIYGRLTLTSGTTNINGANISIDPNPSFTGATALGGTSKVFEVSGAATLSFTSGSVTLVNPISVATSGRDLSIVATSGTVTISGGTIYIGDGSSTRISTGAVPGFLNGSSFASMGNNIVVQTGNTPGRNFYLNTTNLNLSGTGTLTVAANGVLDCGSKTINGTGTFNLLSGATIKTSIATGINGIFANSTTPWTGTTNLNTGANYEFDGPTASAVTGTLMPATVNNLTIGNTSGVTLTNTTTATTLNINAGAKLTNNTGLTLTATTFNILSDATNGTGTYLDNGTSTITTANVNQYLSSARNWYISSPVTGAKATTGYTFYSRDEVNNNWVTMTTGNGTTTGDVLIAGQGYIANLASGTPTYQFTGTLNNGDVTTPSLTRQGSSYAGYNLVGNPYPSYLNLSADNSGTIYLDTTKVWGSYWLRTVVSSAYKYDTYNLTLGAGTFNNGVTASSYIPPMQAFWVRVKEGTSSTTLTFKNAMRSHINTATNLFRAPSATKGNTQLLYLAVNNGLNEDQIILAFNSNASNGLDAYDSPKFSNNSTEIAELYTTVGTEQLAINGMNSIPEREIPLGFKTLTTGTLSIKATEFSNFDSNTKVYLKDKLLGTESDLTGGTAYTFASDIASTTDRFSLVFKVVGIKTDINAAAGDQATLIYKNANNQIAVNCNDIISNDAMVSVYNAIGQKLQTKQITGTTTVIDNTFTSGVYVVTVNNSGKSTTKKVILN